MLTPWDPGKEPYGVARIRVLCCQPYLTSQTRTHCLKKMMDLHGHAPSSGAGEAADSTSQPGRLPKHIIQRTCCLFWSALLLLPAGSVEVTPDIAEELLQAADQYMLEGLKRLCEAAISAGLSTDSLSAVYDAAENYNAPQLGRRCVLYALEHYEDMVRRTGCIREKVLREKGGQGGCSSWQGRRCVLCGLERYEDCVRRTGLDCCCVRRGIACKG